MKRWNHGKKALCLALALALCLTLTTLSAFGEEAPGEETRYNMVELLSGSKLDLEPYLGKAVFINFFTEWCPNCVAEMPDIKQAFDTYSQDELEIILVHVWAGEDASNTENVRKTFGMEEMHFFEDEDMGLTQMLGVPGFPTSLFIDKEGYFSEAVVGSLHLEQLSEILEGLGVSRADAAATDAVAADVVAAEEAATEEAEATAP